MATVNPTVNRDVSAAGGAILVTWTGVNGGDTVVPFKLDKYTVSSCQISGTTITSVALLGSNDVGPALTNLAPVKDWTGTPISGIAAAAFFTPRDIPLWLQPQVTTGVSVNFAVMLHRADLAVIG